METVDIKHLCKVGSRTQAASTQRLIADMLTSVRITCEVPAGTVFGPNSLHRSSLFESIAFIAIKCVDTRRTPYMLQVDTSATNLAQESFAWLRMVQTAREPEEQNLEAYVSDGQLFFKALRNIQKDSELLAWFGKELAELLSICPVTRRSKGGHQYTCLDCNQSFLFEFPLLAHQRFLCTAQHTRLRNSSNNVSYNHWSSGYPLLSGHSKSLKREPTTDFHNLARDFENRSPLKMGRTAKRRLSLDSEADESDGEHPYLAFSGAPAIKKMCGGSTWNGTKPFAEISRQSLSSSPGSMADLDSEHCTRLCQAAFASHLESRSAFSRPLCSGPQISPLLQASKVNSALPSILTQAKIQGSKLQSSALLNGSLLKQSPFLYNSSLWPKASAHQPQVPTIRPLLSSSTIGLAAQNWCAKCNLSFHMTSDLVQHMRSHHKRALSTELTVKQRRVEKLSCPICKEAFREHHHLSRHMTSHA